MATRKNNFLNAKPVSKMGGKSGGVRKPSKPYSKPSSTSGKPKLKAKPQKPAARDVMPNSRAKKINLPQAANNAVPPKQGPTLKGTTPKKRISPNAARDSMPNSRAKGINLPKAANNAIPPKQGPSLKGVKPGLRSSAKPPGLLGAAGRALVPIQLGLMGAEAATQAGYARGGKNYKEFVRAQDKPPAKPQKPVNRDPNGRSSKGVNTPKGRTVATGSQQYNDYRNKQIADNRERLKGVGNPPTPKPPAPPRQNPPAPAADQRRSGGGNNTAPRSQTPPTPRFTGTADEGRKMWAEKYSSSKYDGQAIQKEAKKLLDEMKKRKEDKSNATKAGWDGNKNY